MSNLYNGGKLVRRAVAFTALFALAAVNLALVSYSPRAMAEDIDIFTANPAVAALRPNVLLMVDNSANWGSATKAPFVNEKAALVATVNGLDDRFNVGLMLFAETGGGNNNPTDDGYIRAGVRQLTTTHKNALAGVVQNLDDGTDKSNNVAYGLGMAEAYRYFRGATAYSGIGQKKRDFQGNVLSGSSTSNIASNAQYALAGTTHAFTNSSSTVYNSPISDACQNNFIILISNGPATDSTNGSNSTLAQSQLAAAQGNTAEIALSPNGSQANRGDEWARFVGNTDVNPTIAGVQNIVVYTVDVNPSNSGQGPGHSALLRSMSEGVGKGGRYFAVSDANGGSQIQIALNEIFAEVLAKNSVFAASSLPASVSPRGTFLNQVYMGVFRPDAQARPRWPGNLKQYELGRISGGPVQLIDNSSPAKPVENAITGFVNPAVTSFWTQASTFWNAATYPDLNSSVGTSPSSGPSDAPDGDLIEKGGAAYRLRSVYATDVTTRKLYTCPTATGCTTGSALSATLFDTANTDITATALGDAALDKDEMVRWLRGENRKLDDNATATNTRVRGYIHGDVVHSKPSIINYNRTGQPTDRDLWLFYGGNDGVLRAVKGGQDNADGAEAWGFVAPEFLGGLARLYRNTPLISTTERKPYFFDGPVSVWTKDANGDGQITTGASGDKALVFASARRGGRLLYAFDVTDPSTPKFLWKISNTGSFAELGQTWGEVRVVKVRGQADPVLVLSGGYDAAANDVIPRGTAAMGRGVFMLNALTGAPIWHAAGPATGPGGVTYRQIAGMDYSIVADPVVIDSNNDGFSDRMYFVDTDANIWRINIDTGTTNLSTTWNGAKLAALGGTGSNQRKFLQAPDVVPFDASYDSVLIGSGDRENPLDVSIQNDFFMVKDAHALNALPATPLTIGDLVNTSTVATVSPTANGWYFALSQGEKVVTGSTTLNGVTFFSTNVPESTLTSVGGSCSAGLGEARDYLVSFRDSASVTDFNANGLLSVVDDPLTSANENDRYQKRAGGGLPPSPVAATVCLGPNGTDCIELVLSGSKVREPPKVVLGRRYRSFWSIQNER